MSVSNIRRLAIVMLIGASPSFAQTAQDDEAQRLERVRTQLEQATTRPREDAPPVGAPATDNDRARIDWSAVRALLEETRQKDMRADTVVTRPVSRPGGLRAAPLEQFPSIRLAEVERPRLPVLAPASPQVLATLQVFGQPDAYTAIAEAADGVSLRVSGARKSLVVGDGRAAERLKRMKSARSALADLEADYLVTRSESSTDLSFSKFGAGYVVSLSCDEPDTDPRCTEDDFIVALAGSMALLNTPPGE